MIYRIAKNDYKFKEPDLIVDRFIDNFPHEIDYFDAQRFTAKNLKLKSWWKKVDFRFENIESMAPGDIPDICIWDGPTLILNDIAYGILNEIMQPHGEFLELECGGDPYYL